MFWRLRDVPDCLQAKELQLVELRIPGCINESAKLLGVEVVDVVGLAGVVAEGSGAFLVDGGRVVVLLHELEDEVAEPRVLHDHSVEVGLVP